MLVHPQDGVSVRPNPLEPTDPLRQGSSAAQTPPPCCTGRPGCLAPLSAQLIRYRLQNMTITKQSLRCRRCRSAVTLKDKNCFQCGASLPYLGPLHLLAVCMLLLLIAVKTWETREANRRGVETSRYVCRAAIGTVFGRPVEIIEVESQHGDQVNLAYKRPSDGTIWRNKCKLKGTQILWGAFDGRWRTHELDDRLHFESRTDQLTIVVSHPDGSTTRKQFSSVSGAD